MKTGDTPRLSPRQAFALDYLTTHRLRTARQIGVRSDVLWRLEHLGLISRNLHDQWYPTAAGKAVAARLYDQARPAVAVEKRGRPKLGGSDSGRSVAVSIPMPPEMFEAVHAVAAEYEMTISGWVRLQIKRALVAQPQAG